LSGTVILYYVSGVRQPIGVSVLLLALISAPRPLLLAVAAVQGGRLSQQPLHRLVA